MKPWLYQLGGAIAGGGLGFIVGSIACDVLYPEYEEIQVDIDTDGEGSVSKHDNFVRAAERVRTTKAKKAKKGDARVPVDYNSISWKHKPVMQPVEKIEANIAAYSGDDDPDRNLTAKDEPHIISEEDYGMFDDYKTIELTYYDQDDIVTGEAHAVVLEPETILGDDGLLFGDDDVLFIRNHANKTDYQVTRFNKSYAEMVMGLKPKPATKGHKVKMLSGNDD